MSFEDNKFNDKSSKTRDRYALEHPKGVTRNDSTYPVFCI